MSDRDESGGSWTLLTGHGHVLVEIARNPTARIRDISAAVDLTERTVQVIVADLEAAGYLTRTRTGRRTRYTVNHDSVFRHRAQDGHRVGPFLSLLAVSGEDARTTPANTKSTAARPTNQPAPSNQFRTRANMKLVWAASPLTASRRQPDGVRSGNQTLHCVTYTPVCPGQADQASFQDCLVSTPAQTVPSSPAVGSSSTTSSRSTL